MAEFNNLSATAPDASQKIPLVCIVGPTASGKTSLSIALAKHYNAEIISCDSMQIYREMSISTAKPDSAEQDGIPHHLMDFLPVEKDFSVAQYTEAAAALIRKLHQEGKKIILTGGTGLYYSSLIDNIQFSPIAGDPALRQELERFASEHGGQFLLNELKTFDPETAAQLHPNNLGRIIRAIEVYRLTGITIAEHNRRSRALPSPYHPCVIGLDYADRQKLYDRINLRVDIMRQMGLEDEIKRLHGMQLSQTALQAIGYKELLPWLEGVASLDECLENLKLQSRRYAKRQLTWFRRDQKVNWIYPDQLAFSESILKLALQIIQQSGIWGS